MQKEIQQRYQAEEVRPSLQRLFFWTVLTSFRAPQEAAAAEAEAAKNAADAEKSLEARDAAELETMNGLITNEPEASVLRDSVLEYLKTKVLKD